MKIVKDVYNYNHLLNEWIFVKTFKKLEDAQTLAHKLIEPAIAWRDSDIIPKPNFKGL